MADEWAQFAVPSAAWLQSATKKDMLALLQSAPEGFRAQYSLSNAAKTVLKKNTKTAMMEHVERAISLATEVATPAPPAPPPPPATASE